MNTTYIDVINLIKESLALDCTACFDVSDWKATYIEMCLHNIESLPGDILDYVNMPNDLKQVWTNRILHRYVENMSQIKQLCEIDQLFENCGIKWALLKGLSAAKYFPNPYYRYFGDIDILVESDQFDNAVNQLEAIGYQNIDINHQGLIIRHYQFQKNGVIIELHRYYALNLNTKENQLLEKIVDDGLNFTVRTQIDEVSFNTLPESINGLVLIEHIAHHIESGIGLRPIIDFVVFANSQNVEELEESGFFTNTRLIGLEKLMNIVLLMANQYFNYHFGTVWTGNVDQSKIDICDRLMLHVMNQGHMGIKINTQTRKIIKVFNRTRGGIPGWWSYLKRSGEYNWTLSQKQKALKPFVRLHQMGRYIKQYIRSQYSMSDLLSDYKNSRKQRKLLSDLGLSEHRC